VTAHALTRATDRVGAIAEWIVYAIVVVLVVGPGVFHARTAIVGAGDDARYYTWLGWRIGRLIAHGHVIPVHIRDVIWPSGLDLRLLDGALPSYVSGLFNVLFRPILSYNLTFVTGAILNLISARALARTLSSRRVVHVVVAVAFVTAPPIALNVQQGLLPLFWAFTIPLLVADAIEVARGERAVRMVRLALLLVVAYLCSVYFLVFGGLTYGIIVGVAALRRRSRQIPLAVAGAIAMTCVALVPFIVPRLAFDRTDARGAGTELLAESNIFSADALSIIAQPTRSTLLVPRPGIVERSLQRLPDPRVALEQTIFPGFLVLAGFVVMLCAADTRRLSLAAAAGGLWILALGPSLKIGGDFVWTHGSRAVSWLPYRALLSVPALGALRVPIRAGYVLVVVLVAATAIACERVLSTGKLNAVALGGGCAVLLATNLLLPLPTATMGTTPASEQALRAVARLAQRGDTVVRVPADCDPSFVSLQVFHRAPVVGCAGSFAANPWRTHLLALARSESFAKLRCDRTRYGRLSTDLDPEAPLDASDLSQLRTNFGVRFLVVDRSLLGFCPTVGELLPFLERYRSLGGDARYEIIDVTAPADPARSPTMQRP
jgi:hypothetical protein